MLSAEQYQKIESFFAGEMNAAEEAVFRAEVNADETFKQEFEFELQLRGLLIEYPVMQEYPPVDESTLAFANAKTLVADALTDGEGRKKKMSNFRLPARLQAAAIVIGLLGIAVLVMFLLNNRRKHGSPMKDKDMLAKDTGVKKIPDTTGKQKTPEIKTPPKQPEATELAFKEHYRLYADHADKSVRLGKVTRAVAEKKFETALYEADHISQLMGNNDTDSVMEGQRHFYKGICFIELKKPDAAIKSFGKALNYNKSIPETVPDIYWYRAMAYLQSGKKEPAVSDFRVLISLAPESGYSKQARSIIALFR